MVRFELVTVELGFEQERGEVALGVREMLVDAGLEVFAELTLFLQVPTFLGLGLCLVGIGYLYQRLVFPPPPARPDPDPT